MRSAVPSFEQSQAQGKGGGDFSSFFDSSPSASSGNNQQNGGGEGNPGGGGVPKGGFTSQTSTEFESIFGGGGGDGGGVSVGMGVGFDAGSPSTQHQQQQQGSSSFASFDSAPSSSLPPRDPSSRRQTNTHFEDFFSPSQPSIVESKRFSVGGTFHAQAGENFNLTPVSDDEGSDDDASDDGVMEVADPSMFHAPPRVQSPSSNPNGGGRWYSVLFETEKKLGMLLERHDEWVQSPGSVGKLKECTVVKLIVEHGAADVKGVTLGSRVVGVNGLDTRSRPYLETLNLVKTTPRPMRITMEEVRGSEGAKRRADNDVTTDEYRTRSFFSTRHFSSVTIATILTNHPNPFLHHIASLISGETRG